MKKIYTLLLAAWTFICIISCAGNMAFTPANDAEKAAQELAQRVFPHKYSDIVFRLQESENDFYSLETVDGKLVICGNNANSMAVGFGNYLKDWCKLSFTWYERDKVAEPRRLPAVEQKVTRDALVKQRFFLNYCTYGYSLNWWQWKDWEHMIDWMAMNGVTIALNNSGQESVWLNVWQKFGLSEEQIKAYFVGPSYLSWHRMTNMDAWDGPLPDSWLEGQCEMQKKIIEREVSLGISPILSSFTGHVPAVLKEKFPDADIRKLSAWGNFEYKYNPWYLSPTDPLFKEIQKAFLEEQKKIYGQDTHIYGVDLFNEVDPPMWDAAYLEEAARLTYEAMEETDPQAIWLQMSWLFWHKRAKWTQDLIEAYLKPVPKGRLIMLDYYCEQVEIYRQTQGFYGQDFIWSYLGNFGGATMIAGNVKDISMKIDRVYKDAPESCVGLGCTLEGLDVNPQMYEYVLDRAWTKEKTDSAWFAALADRHLGKADENYRAAWDIMYNKVHKQIAGHTVAMIPARPNMAGTYRWQKKQYAYKNIDMLDAWGHLCASEPSKSASYRFDCVNFARQCLDNYFTDLYLDLLSAYKKGDADVVKRNGARMLEILDDVNAICATDSYFLLGKWIADARALGKDAAEADYFEHDSRNILACWGFKGGKLTDYAGRDWNGLISSYYRPRWEKFINELTSCLDEGRTFDAAAFENWCFDFEWDWIDTPIKFQSKPSGNAIKITRELYSKYKDEILAENK